MMLCAWFEHTALGKSAAKAHRQRHQAPTHLVLYPRVVTGIEASMRVDVLECVSSVVQRLCPEGYGKAARVAIGNIV